MPSCPSCQRPVSGALEFCIYCKTPLKNTPQPQQSPAAAELLAAPMRSATVAAGAGTISNRIASSGTLAVPSAVKTIEAFHDFLGSSAGVTIEYHPKLNAASVHCGFPVIRKMTITVGGLISLTDLIVTIEVPIYSRAWSKTIPNIDPGRQIELADIRLQLDFERLSRLKEADTTAQIVVTLTHQGTVLRRESFPLEVLAFNEWRWDLPIETLAAFVIPNNDAIEQILNGAARILKERTGSDALPGYQMGSERVQAMGAAVFDACRDICKIGYINPPPSYEQGQKIFLPDDLVKYRRGTCLDLALLLAACYERTGLHPVLFLIPGHAFVGIWVPEDPQFPTVACTESLRVLWEAFRGRLLAIEATAFTSNATFEEAVSAADINLLAAVTQTIAIDVQLARNAGIRPLPLPPA